MRNLALTIVSLLPFMLSGQTYQAGIMMCKLHDTTALTLDTLTNADVNLKGIYKQYGFTKCYQPIKGYSVPLDGIYTIKFDEARDPDSLINALEDLPYVEYAERLPNFRIFETPDDFNPQQQYFLTKIDALGAWEITTGSKDVVVAVVDNAVNVFHEDLADNIWVNPGEIAGNGLDDDLNGYIDDIYGYDVADGDNDPNPPAGSTDTSAWIHGSHCSGIVSASTNNSKGVASLGQNLSLMAVKCTPDDIDGDNLPGAFDGLLYALRAGADVVSMSFGTYQYSRIVEMIIREGHAKGVVMIAAAGNENTDSLSYPAAYEHVIAVAATNQFDRRASFSNYGSWVDVSAPGVQIKSTFSAMPTSYGSISGTSMSTPLVAALAGLVLSIDPSATPDRVEQLIKQGCDNIEALNPPAYKGLLGAGRINAAQTLQLATGIKENDMKIDNLVIYPNPSEKNTIFYLQGLERGTNYVDIFDAQGQLVHSVVVYAQEGKDETLAMRDAVAGVYLLRIRSDKGMRQERVVIY